MENNEKLMKPCENKLQKGTRNCLFEIFEAFRNNISDEVIDYIAEKLHTGEEAHIARISISRNIPKKYIELLIENYRENPDMEITDYKLSIIRSNKIHEENLIRIIKNINHLGIIRNLRDMCEKFPQEKIDKFVNICLRYESDFKNKRTETNTGNTKKETEICEKLINPGNRYRILIEIEKALADDLSDHEIEYLLTYDTWEEVETRRFLFKHKTPAHWILKILENEHYDGIRMIKLIAYNKIDDETLEKIFNFDRNYLVGLLLDACECLPDEKLNKFVQICLEKNNLIGGSNIESNN